MRTWDFPGDSVVKNLPANTGDASSNPGFERFLGAAWCRKWQPVPVFLPGKFHGQRSLTCYSPWVRKESDTTEYACMQVFFTDFFKLVLY